jgi:hypothetical protein
MPVALPEDVRGFVEAQARAAYDLVAAARHPGTGAYADAIHLRPSPQAGMCSVAAVGVGLVALSLAAAEGWEADAASLARQTLQGMTGRLPGFRPAREASTGFFSHFVDLLRGDAWPGSEFSTIDTALLVAGALFAARSFAAAGAAEAGEIAALAEELFASVRWGAAVADPRRGVLHMVVEPGGAGRIPAHPFNEYALLAWLIRRAHPGDHPCARMWDEVFAPERLARLPHARFEGSAALTDDPAGQRFLSSFVHLFPFYLVHVYADSPTYRAELAAAAEVDRRYWRTQPGVPEFVWGLGAGASIRGYHADAVGDCPDGIASPHIVAGFLPVHPQGVWDLYALARAGRARLDAADLVQAPAAARRALGAGLHRFVALPTRTPWVAPFVPLIDWSTMLYGLVAFRRGMAPFLQGTRWQQP